MRLTQNVGGIDKIARIVGGLALVGAAVYLGMWWLAAAGALLALTGLVGRCGLYYLLGINTCRTQPKP
ncbi:MAG: hypothetical protein KatS3mg026_0090 [Bacteroidia bacterium]|nr:MAG: hypothetical protein KatS3mg026_0090 [Bacteroidia bacterium]